MTTIFERISTALATLLPAIDYAMAPYKGELPDTYVVYQLVPPSSAEQHADNIETERSYTVQVTTWDVNGLINLPDVDTAMRSAGFMKGDQRQLPQDPETGHYGMATDYLYIESQE